MDEDITDIVIEWFGKFLLLKSGIAKRSHLWFITSTILSFFLWISNFIYPNINFGSHAIVSLSDMILVICIVFCLTVFIVQSLFWYWMQKQADVFIDFICPDKNYTIIKGDRK